MKRIIFFLVICVCSTTMFSQNITNTLGTSGLFIIKDGSNNYLTLDQSTGQMNVLKTLRLENTTSPDAGVIYKGNNTFIHNFGNSNSFSLIANLLSSFDLDSFSMGNNISRFNNFIICVIQEKFINYSK